LDIIILDEASEVYWRLAQTSARLAGEARQDVGYQLDKVQRGKQPDDFKPMTTIGVGVEEIRVRDETGIYRVIYFARLPEAVFVLHVFQKKSQATSIRDIRLGQERFTQLLKDRR